MDTQGKCLFILDLDWYPCLVRTSLTSLPLTRKQYFIPIKECFPYLGNSMEVQSALTKDFNHTAGAFLHRISKACNHLQAPLFI